MTRTLTETALLVAERYPVFPCGKDKQPVLKGGFHRATRDPDTVRDLFAIPGAELIGVPTGAASGLLVVDVDPAGEGWLDIQRLILPTTREHSTRRGTHLLFKMPETAVGCSTGKVAPGVDIRAEGGYIIWWPAANLNFKSGDLAAVPDSILEAIARPAPAPAVDEMHPDFKDKCGVPPEGARQLLAMVNPDCSYDDWRSLGMGLEHEYGEAGFELWRQWSSKGKKYPGDTELETKWASFGRYDGPPVTLRYLIKLAKAQTAEAPPAPVEGRTSPYRIVSSADLMVSKPQRWIVRDLIPRADLGMLYAVGGAGKTFFALDLALHIATGVQWRDKATEQRRVLYICAEGSGAFGVRMRAALQGDANLAGGMADPDCVFDTLTGAPNFLDDKAINQLIKQAAGLGGYQFVVIDTLAQVTPGGNENSGEDMGGVIGNCRKFNTAFGAFVLILHHPGKDESKGARGWSGIRGALDVELEITRAGDSRVARVTKQKDGIDGGQFGFRLDPLDLVDVLDEDGFPVVSCRVEVLADLPKRDRPKRKDGPVETFIFTHAANLAGVCGGPFDKEQLYRLVIGELEPGGGRDQRRTSVANALNRLKRDKRIIDRGGDLLELPQ